MKIRRALTRMGATALLTVGACLAPAAVAVSHAASATCPPSGTRYKLASGPTVYLVGPHNVTYFFITSTDYFNLFSSYSGITTVADTRHAACTAVSPRGVAWPLDGAKLVKKSGNPAVYLYDSDYSDGYRWITSQSVFDKYGFDSSEIKTVSSVSPIAANWDQ